MKIILKFKKIHYSLNNTFLNSSTETTNLHILQNNTSLFTISLNDVGIFPQYSELLSQFGQHASNCFMPNSFVRFNKSYKHLLYINNR